MRATIVVDGDAGDAGPSGTPLQALLSPVSVATFEEHYWEQRPLLVRRELLPAAFDGLLGPLDLAELSERMVRWDVQPQIVREGERCAPRELLRDFVDGGSAIINRVDHLWAPVGRLCAALRADFLHVFAVMYLTPRDSQAVPAHTDDQDVFILQLSGTKAWTVYGAPVELPNASEQLGKDGPIPEALWETLLREPVLSAELTPGSVLYLPRGAVHEARATAQGGSSLHITLTVQSSDLNWKSFVNDGLLEIHRGLDAPRRALSFEDALGGWPVHAGTFEAATRGGGGEGGEGGGEGAAVTQIS